MRFILDENLPRLLKRELPDHDAVTVQDLGWSGIRNGALLRRAAAERYDALLTMDQSIAYQHPVAALPIGIVVLVARSNTIEDLRPLVNGILSAIEAIGPGKVIRVGGSSVS